MFITPAFAQDAGAAAAGPLAQVVQLVPFLLIFVIMYFLIIRPQRKKQKDHQEMLKNIRRGDTIVTAGGVIGKVSKVIDDSELLLDVGEGAKLRVARNYVSELRSKGEPVKE
ncbi:preprotein translocase subunit YajC [Hartmannibacter diazotrophicus]|uniref:Sec translocon accessory complex subunit YajC n=1 Tax=Hartmannibacter diazotrophicus TaxID=1482074 RepID=A0A2C9D4M8_9HYPH|nr:preprotein translocase subunit YajC [Hartmannibacter diazotrophicus]SON55150.1 preprotein translocase subunit YajC [Hartmannibacter diazotrophicus]